MVWTSTSYHLLSNRNSGLELSARRFDRFREASGLGARVFRGSLSGHAVILPAMSLTKSDAGSGAPATFQGPHPAHG